MKNTIILLVALLSNVAAAETISEQDKAFFVAESYSKYHDPVSKIKTNSELLSKKGVGAEDALYVTFKINSNTDDAIQQFSKYFGLDDDLGKIAAQEIITSRKIEAGCTYKRHQESCPPTKFSAENIRLLNNSNKANDILFDIAAALHYRDELPQVIESIRGNSSVLLRLFDYTEDILGFPQFSGYI